MVLEGITPRRVVAIGLLALLPTIGYAVGRPSLGGLVAAVNVVLIFGSLYVAMSPATGHAAHDRPSNGTST